MSEVLMADEVARSAGGVPDVGTDDVGQDDAGVDGHALLGERLISLVDQLDLAASDAADANLAPALRAHVEAAIRAARRSLCIAVADLEAGT
jgi:hypothetical protein